MVTRQPCSSFDLLTALLSGEGFTAFDKRCIEINLRPYLPPKIVYQYQGEPPQEIFSSGGQLSYTIEEIEKQCPGIRYDILLQTAIISNGTLQGWNNTTKVNINSPYNTDAPYSNIRFLVNNNQTEYYDEENYLYHWSFQTRGLPPYGRSKNYRIIADTDNYQNVTLHTRNSFGVKFLGFEAEPNQAPCLNDCKFTVTETFNDGRTVIRYTETREEQCPEVEQFDCSLANEIQTIKAEAAPFEIFFISDGYDPSDGIFDALISLVDTSRIDAHLRGNPENCFLLWKLQRITGIIYELVDVAQVCSDASCPPPEMNYRCFSCCKECPEGTCPVECGDHICCYDNQGTAIESIPIEDYCND